MTHSLSTTPNTASFSESNFFKTEENEPEVYAPLQEIFSSIQGEGIYVGRRQIFVRFAHCHLKCAYCDTPMTSSTGKCHVEVAPGSGRIDYLENPVPISAVFEAVSQLLPQAAHHSVSFTGGEPLLYHRFLRQLLPQVQSVTKTYLETSGTQPDFLQEVLPWTDIIAMDIKLPSATHEPAQFDHHASFYQVARTRLETMLFIKLIFSEATTEEEIQAVEAIVADRNTPIILQPVTDLSDRNIHITAKTIFRLEHRLSQTFADVRVIPQTHKMLQVL